MQTLAFWILVLMILLVVVTVVTAVTWSVWKKPWVPLQGFSPTVQSFEMSETRPPRRKSTLVVMACHTSTKERVDIILNNIPYFSEIADEMVLIDSAEFQSNGLESKIRSAFPGLRFQMYHIPNDPLFLCHDKYLFYLQGFFPHYHMLERVILTNDSILVCHSLVPFGKLKDSEDYDMTSMVASRQIQYHFTDFLRSYSTSVIPSLVQYFVKNRHKVHSNASLIQHYEIESTFVFKRKKALLEAESGYYENIHYDDKKIREYLTKYQYPILKVKKLVHMRYHEWKDWVPLRVHSFLPK